MALIQLTNPAEEPVSVDEALNHLRADDTPGDRGFIEALISASRHRAELHTELALVSCQFGLYLDKFPAGEFRLPRAPLVSIESVKYFDESNVEQTIDPAQYYVDTISKPGRISPVTGWPATYPRPNAVSIIFTAGFGTAENVPQVIKQAILLMVGDMYENREDTTSAPLSKIPSASEHLLRPFRLLG